MDKNATCDRVWLLYLQGRLSPAQLLALCQLSTDEDATEPAPNLPAPNLRVKQA